MTDEQPEYTENPIHSQDNDAKAIKHIDDGSDRSLSSKQSERAELEAQIAAFLKNGGAVNVIDQNVLADPPKRPVSNYGSRPI